MSWSWKPMLDALNARKKLAYAMGGEEKIARQRAHNRLTVRERIDKLLDAGSFREFGTIAGRAEYEDDGETIRAFTPANFVFGRGSVDARPVVVGGDDFTVRGGAADAAIREKMLMSERFAHDWRVPLIRLIEGTGGGGSVKTLETAGHTYVPANPAWDLVIANLSRVPVVSLGLGPVAGLGAARMAASHLAVLVKDIAQMFIAGPPVVRRLGEETDKETLGGAMVHARNGAVDACVDTEEEAFALTRRFLSYLPASVYELPARGPCVDPPDRRDEELLSIVPESRRRTYDMRRIIASVVDKDSFLEVGAEWGRSLIGGLARLDGWPVALIAGDPKVYGGGWTADTALKATRFVDLAQTFHLPVVHLVDCPGFVIGADSERAATIRHGTRATAAIYQATTPWCSILIRKAFGVAGAAHSDHAKAQFRYAWPSGDWGSLPVEGGLEAAYRSELEASPDPQARLAEIEAKLERARSPLRVAEAFGVEEIIDPRETRAILCEFANLAAPLRQATPPSFGYRP